MIPPTMRWQGNHKRQIWRRLTSQLHTFFSYPQLKHPYLITLVVLVGYLVIFQHHFLFSGDIWAEGYAEYLVEAVTKDWGEVIRPSWEGYLTLVPSFFSKLYISLQLPVGYVDYYYRFVVVSFALASISFIGWSGNRRLIQNDYIRLGLAVMCLATLNHVSSFSFINVWYIGFIPAILVSLSLVSLSRIQKVAYIIFTMLVALTKPSVILLPFVLYRLIKQREYAFQGLLLAAISLQTYLLFFAYPGGKREVVFSPLASLVEVIIGSGVMVLKLFKVYPGSFVVIALAIVTLVTLAVGLVKAYGWWTPAALICGLFLAVYTYLLAPGAQPEINLPHYQAIYANMQKLQREIIIVVLLLLGIFMTLDWLSRIRRLSVPTRWRTAGLILILVLLPLKATSFNPIDMESSLLAADISAYRHDLNANKSLCVPIPPHWYYQHRGGCMSPNLDRQVDPHQFQLLTELVILRIPSTLNQQIKSLVVVVTNPHPRQPAQLRLTDLTSHQVYHAQVPAKATEHLSYISFNLAGSPARAEYQFSLAVTPGKTHPTGSQLGLVNFKNSSDPALYPYFIGLPNWQ